METKRKNGFTLFELLVSISIIGILVAIASVSYTAAQKKARDARRMEDIQAIQKAAEQYYANHTANYPTSSDISAWDGVLNTFPVDPKYNSADAAAWSDYVYNRTYDSTSGATTYCVCARVEDTTKGNATNSTGLCDFLSTGTKNFYCLTNQQ